MDDCSDTVDHLLSHGVFFLAGFHELIKLQNFVVKTIETKRCVWWYPRTNDGSTSEGEGESVAHARHQVEELDRDGRVSPRWTSVQLIDVLGGRP